MKTKTDPQNELIRLMFEKLLTWLQPVETSRSKDYTWGYNNKKRYWEIIFAQCNFSNAENIPVPEGIKLTITEEMITISGNDFEYKFAPDMILTVWNRLKKATR